MQVSLSAIALLLGLLGGCAAPQYQTNVSLIPPEDVAGRSCVQGCDTARGACEASCQRRYQACATALEPQVEAHYEAALKQYESDLRQYAAALRHYEMQLQFEWMRGDFYPYPYAWWHPWPWPVFSPVYREPVMPSRDSVRARLLKSECRQDCGCQPAYEACFAGCGGQIMRETVCIRNCPPAE